VTPDRLSRIPKGEAALFVKMAGCRSRIVHFYDRVSDAELYELCSNHLTDVEAILGGLHRWIREHPDKIDSSV